MGRERTTTATFACPIFWNSPVACGQALTATFDAEGNLRAVEGNCEHARSYGAQAQAEADYAALNSAAIRAAVDGGAA